MRTVNLIDCELPAALEQGAFGHVATQLGELLESRVLGAGLYELRDGKTVWPYHYHHGVEEWLYVVSGAPVLRDPSGERELAPGAMVAFPAGPDGAHTVRGPGRFAIFAAGARGWGAAFASIYVDSDKIGAAPGVLFRRSDAIASWSEPKPQASAFGGETWTSELHELAPGQAAGACRYEWCRESWLLVLDGAPTLRHAEGERALAVNDVACLPEGPDGAHQLVNRSDAPARAIVFSSPRGQPMTAFYPDEDELEIRVSEHEGLRFRIADQIEDYWAGEPGA